MQALAMIVGPLIIVIAIRVGMYIRSRMREGTTASGVVVVVAAAIGIAAGWVATSKLQRVADARRLDRSIDSTLKDLSSGAKR